MLLRLVLACLLLAPPAWDGAALARTLSSGGYSAPGSSSWSTPTRRPSISGSSGGYSRPSSSFAAPSGGSSAPLSGGDRAISRQSSGEALRQYRAPPPATGATGATGGAYDYDSRRPSTGTWSGRYGATPFVPEYRGWSPAPAPQYYGWAQPSQSFGLWNGLMLWGLLNSLSSPGHAQFFYNNQDDPGYQTWRAEANQASRDDPALRAKLAELDQRVADLQGQPKSAGALPPDVEATPPAHAGGGGHWVIVVLFLAIAAFALLWLFRRRAAHAATAGGPVAVPAALRGSTATRFRVGMTIPVDPTPFILAASATKVRGIDGSGMISVEAIGVLMDGAAALNRLYLPGRESFFLLHLGADGRPDECRYFSRVDEVTPGNADEWGAWLDPAQGMIGWPQFQTKDGVLYDRVWNPGAARIAPREMTETLQDLQGTTTRKLTAMLYGRPTGAAAPAPSTEYILVAAVDAGQQAFVEIHAGIDVNPASLTLPAVPL
jgi:hypothetical protein